MYSFTVLGDDGAVVVVDAGAQEGGVVLNLHFPILHINPIDVLRSPLERCCYLGLLDRGSQLILITFY